MTVERDPFPYRPLPWLVFGAGNLASSLVIYARSGESAPLFSFGVLGAASLVLGLALLLRA